ncbi:hypothetical protein [Actinokineospora sp.]|uniref:hypothetical protein n=1 Tax=Actinokineospora sp. TaxID=1872133 RepID=UPI003D6AB3C1
MSVEPAKVPWYAVGLVVVGAICSAFVAAANFGAGFAAMELPALLGYAQAVVLHLIAARVAWGNARSMDSLARNWARRAINVAAAFLFIGGALTAQLRHQWDGIATIVPGMALIGLLSAAGPILLIMFFFPHRHATA